MGDPDVPQFIREMFGDDVTVVPLGQLGQPDAVVKKLGGHAVQAGTRMVFSTMMDALETGETVLRVLVMMTPEHRQKVCEEQGFEPALFRRAVIQLHRAVELIYESAAPSEEDGPEMIQRYIATRRKMREARNDVARSTADLA
jgi:hypothetical protein